MRQIHMQVRPDHPLNQLFAELINKHVVLTAGIDDIQISRYLARILTDFTHVNSLYRVRNAKGKRLEEVAEMLIESNPLLEASSFIREREVRKHVGDYTMFVAGLFPEYVARLPRRNFRVDALINNLRAGKNPYKWVASFDHFNFGRKRLCFANSPI